MHLYTMTPETKTELLMLGASNADLLEIPLKIALGVTEAPELFKGSGISELRYRICNLNESDKTCAVVFAVFAPHQSLHPEGVMLIFDAISTDSDSEPKFDPKNLGDPVQVKQAIWKLARFLKIVPE